MSNNFLENLDLQYKLSTKLLEQSFVDMNPTNFKKNFKDIHHLHQKFANHYSEQNVNDIKDKFYSNFLSKITSLYHNKEHSNFSHMLELTNDNLTFYHSQKPNNQANFLTFYFFNTTNSKNALKTLKFILKTEEFHSSFIITHYGTTLIKNQSDDVFQTCFPLIKQIIKKSPYIYDFPIFANMLYYRTKNNSSTSPTFNPNSFKDFINYNLKHIFQPKENSIQLVDPKGKLSFANIFFSYLNNIEDLNFNSQDKENYHSLLEIYNKHHTPTTFIDTVVDLSYYLYKSNNDIDSLNKWLNYAINSQEHTKTMDLFNKLNIPNKLYPEFYNYYNLNQNMTSSHKKNKNHKL